jgi:hypothetical protein
MYHAITAAKLNTEQLTYELKMLYHGIREYLRKIQEQRDVNVLLADHFDEYKTLADRIYHPIKTMDSVYRYKAPVIEILTDMLGDDEMMESIRKRAIAIRKYESEEEAGEEVLSAINYVLDVYQSIGGIVNEIDKKHSVYTKLSIETIRYHMTADQSIAGKLITLLKAYASASCDESSTILDLLERGINIGRQEFLDGRSLWRKNIKNRRIITESLSVSIDELFTENRDISILSTLSDDYSLRKIKEYMEKQFKDRNSVSSGEIEIYNDKEFILLLLAAIRAGERNTGFKAQFGDNFFNTNGYKIPEIMFTKKGS